MSTSFQCASVSLVSRYSMFLRGTTEQPCEVLVHLPHFISVTTYLAWRTSERKDLRISKVPGYDWLTLLLCVWSKVWQATPDGKRQHLTAKGIREGQTKELGPQNIHQVSNFFQQIPTSSKSVRSWVPCLNMLRWEFELRRQTFCLKDCSKLCPEERCYLYYT